MHTPCKIISSVHPGVLKKEINAEKYEIDLRVREGPGHISGREGWVSCFCPKYNP
jgi:hypothetical protein